MEEGPDNFEVIEWTVENFGCWNALVHEGVIESQTFGGSLGVALKLELRPGGRGERLVARVRSDDEPAFIEGVFSFLGADGGVLAAQQVVGTSPMDVEGPEFNDVIADIRKKELSHGDRLTLRCKAKLSWNKVLVARTCIQVTSCSLRISRATLDGLKSGFNWILRTFYPVEDGATMGEMDLSAQKSDSKVTLSLDHESEFIRNVLVHVDVLKGDRLVEEKEHVFMDRECWEFLDVQHTSGDEALLLKIKVVPSSPYRHQGGHYMPGFVSRQCLV